MARTTTDLHKVSTSPDMLSAVARSYSIRKGRVSASPNHHTCHVGQATIPTDEKPPNATAKGLHATGQTHRPNMSPDSSDGGNHSPVTVSNCGQSLCPLRPRAAPDLR